MSQKSYDLDKIYTILRPLGEKPLSTTSSGPQKSDVKIIHIGPPRQPLNKKILCHAWNLVKQTAFASLIFGIFFLALNWPAYSKIFQVKYNDIMDIAQTNVMQEFVAPKPAPKQELLKVDKNPEVEKKNIPYFALKVSPPDTRLVIPRINKNIPIVQVSDTALLKRDFDVLEANIQKGLEGGVINYPGTSKPGEHGNVVITGHSSYFPWKPGRFKDAFAILEELREGDKIAMFHKQRKYTYEVFKIEKVFPRNVEPLKPTKEDILTLITCVPVGTDISRLIVKAKLIGIES